MIGRSLLVVLVGVAGACLSYLAINRTMAARAPSAVPVEEADRPAGDSPRTAPRPVTPIALKPRPNDVPVEKPENGVRICRTIASENVSDDLLSRTKFVSRAAMSEFLKKNGEGYNAMRRELLPEFLSKLRVGVDNCYRPRPDDQSLAFLAIHIKSTGESAAVVATTVLRTDAPDQSQTTIRNCLQAFNLANLPVMVHAPPGVRFAEYDDLYLKEVPVALGPGSVAHLLAQRQAERQHMSAP